MTIKEGDAVHLILKIVTLISMPAFPVDAVRPTMDELERIRSRKISEMMSRSNNPPTVGPKARPNRDY